MRASTLAILALTLPGLAMLAAGRERAGLAVLRVAASVEDRSWRRV